ncbi:hypothetical protein EGW08_000299 [Elysia chlorotica]|uniref:NF-kappa-B inhibitor-like protein 1 n=1 Tax=Elysia chlorotica TaxID=188477 RepID=A0A433UDE0_ELYCH|nr:hypothetical protein EGW08_000299 [Elysia chlorotica]
MGLRTRLCRYIKDDRPLKLKSYVSSRDIDLDKVKLRHGQKILHYCALFGSGDMLRCLLRFECDATVSDKDGNLPLHVALQRALSSGLIEAESIFSSVVKPLQQAYPLGQDVENRRGDTAHDLLVLLKDKIKKGRRTSERKQQEDAKLTQDEEERWRRKLEEESLFEYEDQLPRYSAEDDDLFQGREAPSFDRWSDQIQEEFSRKRRQQNQTFWRDKTGDHQANCRGTSTSRPAKSSQDGEQAEKLKRAREEMRKRFKPVPPEKTQSSLLVKKQRYERKFSQLLASLRGKTLTFRCIPWPHADLNSVADVLLCDVPDKSSEAYRKYLRSQRVRWHPDKFTQKFGEHLHGDHVVKIMARVKAISQLLNRLDSERTRD